MSGEETIHLLICGESQQDADQYSAVFRGAGLTVRAHRIASEQDLRDSLADPNWDLLIASDAHPELSTEQTVRLCGESGATLPVIVSLQSYGAEAAAALFAAGATDVIGRDESQRLLHAGRREIDAQRRRRHLAELEVAYAETARRCELLLKAANDAIAYVTDGMHINANEAYAELFGVADVDALAGLPLIDLLSGDDQQRFKDALRKYRNNPEDETQFEFTGVRDDGGTFAATMTMSTASYEGEPCMQVLVRSGGAAPPAGATAPAAGGAAGVDTVVDMTRTALAGSGGHLALVSIDNFDTLARNMGASGADALVGEIGAWLTQQAGWQAPPQRLGPQLFAGVLADTDEAACLKAAQELAGQLSREIFEAGKQSGQPSACAAVAALNGSPDAEVVVDAAWSTLLDLRATLAMPAGASAPRARAAEFKVATAPAAAAGDADALLDQAIQSERLQLLFQPIVSLRGDSSEYYEVSLVVDDSGTTRPAEDWVREHGLEGASSKLDRWLILESLRALRDHRGTHPNTRLLINLDVASVLDDDLPGFLSTGFKASELPPDTVTFQLPLPVVNAHLKNARDFADRLHGLGCKLAISRIGCDGNALTALEHLKPVFAKLDATVGDLLGNNSAVDEQLKPLVESLHGMQLASIMPQVKSAGALAVLWQLGIHFIQGDYLQRPSPVMNYEFTDLA
jgi:PAS domain S-box-containing protein